MWRVPVDFFPISNRGPIIQELLCHCFCGESLLTTSPIFDRGTSHRNSLSTSVANPCNPFLDLQSEHISSSTASGCTCLYCQHCFPVASGTTAHLCLLLSLLFLDFFNLPDFHPVNLLSLSVCLDDILQVFRIFPYRTFLLISSICVKFSRCIPAGRHFRSFTASPARQ